MHAGGLSGSILKTKAWEGIERAVKTGQVEGAVTVASANSTGNFRAKRGLERCPSLR